MGKKNMNFFEKLKEPRIKYGSMSIFITIVVVAVAVLINILAHFMTDKFSLNFDLTGNKVFSITDESLNYLSGIDKNIEIIVLNSKEKFVANGDYFIQADRVVNEYAKNSDKISIKYIDMDENPGIKGEFSQEELNANDIIVKCEGKHKIISPYDIFNVGQSITGGSSITSSKAEQVMTSAIINVTSDTRVKVTMLNGFDEIPSESFTNMLEQNNYEVVSKSMLNDEIDSDSSVVVIYAPKRDYDKQAISKIKNYLESNKESVRNIIYFVNPSIYKTPNLDNLMNEWGIKVGDGLVFESDISKLFSSNSPFNTLSEYVDTTYSGEVQNKNIPVAIPISRPIEILDKEKATTLLEFSQTSGIMPGNADEKWVPTKEDMKGHIPCMVLSKNKSEESEMPSSFIVVGSATAVEGGLLSRNSLNNSSYFLNLFNNITQRPNSINIEPKTMSEQELGLNQIQTRILGIVFALAVPIIILIIGFIVWIVRRKRH